MKFENALLFFQHLIGLDEAKMREKRKHGNCLEIARAEKLLKRSDRSGAI